MTFGYGRHRPPTQGLCTALTAKGLPCQRWATLAVVWQDDGAAVVRKSVCAQHARWWARHGKPEAADAT